MSWVDLTQIQLLSISTASLYLEWAVIIGVSVSTGPPKGLGLPPCLSPMKGIIYFPPFRSPRVSFGIPQEPEVSENFSFLGATELH